MLELAIRFSAAEAQEIYSLPWGYCF